MPLEQIPHAYKRFFGRDVNQEHTRDARHAPDLKHQLVSCSHANQLKTQNPEREMRESCSVE